MIALLPDLAGQFWAHSEKFFEALREAADRRLWGTYSVLLEVPSDLTTLNTPAVLVNIFPMARRGLSAQVDGYFIGPLPVHLYEQTGKKIETVPLFSLQLPVGLLFEVLEFINERRPGWKERFEVVTPPAGDAFAI